MKIIRWLISHSLLILLIVVVIYGYMFWGNLAGEDTPAGKALAYLSSEFVEVEDFITAVKNKQAKLSAQNPSDQKPAAELTAESETVAVVTVEGAATQNQADTAVNKNTQPLSNEQRSIEQKPVSISYSHNQMQVKQNSAGIVEAENIEVNQAQSSQQKEVVATKDKFVSAEVEKQLNSVNERGKVISDAQQQAENSGDEVKATWISARKSFYQRKYDLSEQSYQKVIDSTEDNFDAYGELGNVYFNQGKKEQAASAYFEAAAILVRKGDVNRARSLMGLLRHLDKSKADELKKLIDLPVT